MTARPDGRDAKRGVVSVDRVASMAVELQQLKYAYQASLERVRDLERHYR
jgi:hypothetical protein